jgi:hypothetical protein
MITNEPTTVNSFYSNNAGLSRLESPSTSSIFNPFTWSWTSLFLFFIVLAFLGFNIFVFLAKGSMSFVEFFVYTVSTIFSFFKNIFQYLGNNDKDGESSSKSFSDSSSDSAVPGKMNVEGSKERSNETPTAITSEDHQSNVGTEDDIIKALKKEKVDKLFPPSQQQQPPVKQNGGLSQREQGQQVGMPGQGQQMPSDEPGYNADDSYSSIQMSKSASKSGWCYIGEDRGFRSCIRVGENEQCMSGDIFPSQEICINPKLRH